MPPLASSQSASSTRGEKASMTSTLCLIFILHIYLLTFAAENWTTDELYNHTLLLLTLPMMVGSFPNLKQYQRWIAYYGIWFQLMADACAVENLPYIFFDLVIFTNMENVFRKHLKAITGGQSIPRIVYFSSWVSNTRLDSYIAAHRLEENVNDNEDNSDEQVAPTTTTTITTTTTTITTTITSTTIAMTFKTKLGYLLASIVLLITVYDEVEINYTDYFCYHGPDSNGFYLDPINNYTTGNPKYADYCHPPTSSFEKAFFQYLPIRGLPSLSVVLTRLSALLFAVAWSTIPTNVVVTAWTQMWNSPSSRLRKVHYMVFMYPIIMYPIKMAAIVLIMYYTPDQRENVAPTNYSPSSLSAVRAKYLLLWFVFFRAATKLAFGMGLIWNLYTAHSNSASCRHHHYHQEKQEVEQLL
ncbi:hypothetical protein BG015_005951 [Linnemannia schmuckeri]|uniref:Uncharacterized protein n=1 Tax=Linnemannia schmuckeri TaxID=64567 RepID=A0A9P5S0B3_9FUNG|nr:hypothetical protein BG015_005951 [Linnemannia schmuckeri]